jgi:pyrroline-5-carboxylate reductase
VSAGATDRAGLGGLLLVGCGKMGGALLRGWREQRVAGRFVVVEPGAGAAEFAGAADVQLHESLDAVDPAFRPDVVVFAVKPQMMDGVTPHYGRFAAPGTVFLSIAAGKTLGYFAAHLGPRAAVVRAMPNTPAAIGRGITVACGNATVTPDQRAACDRLLAAVGEVAWVEDEALIDPVTALSGGGPAYVFLLIECLSRAGVAAGLPEDLAKRLARVTVSGAGELARLSPEPPETLRQNVTSPGGTTLAALNVLMAPNGMAELFEKAIAAATARSRELAG